MEGLWPSLTNLFISYLSYFGVFKHLQNVDTIITTTVIIIMICISPPHPISAFFLKFSNKLKNNSTV